ncbi:S1/P1 nuclease [Salinisphaera sp. RV14]
MADAWHDRMWLVDRARQRMSSSRLRSFARRGLRSRPSINGPNGAGIGTFIQQSRYAVIFARNNRWREQPLHAEDHDDRGGNDVRLSYFGHRSNLHRIWDSGIVDHALHLHVGRDYSIDYAPTRAAAARPDADITPRERANWRRGIHGARLSAAAVRWANQAHRLARRVAYADLPAPPRRDGSAAYQHKTWPVVRRQIQRGGVRLATVLNTTLAR